MNFTNNYQFPNYGSICYGVLSSGIQKRFKENNLPIEKSRNLDFQQQILQSLSHRCILKQRPVQFFDDMIFKSVIYEKVCFVKIGSAWYCSISNSIKIFLESIFFHAKNLHNFVSPSLKLHNQYHHTVDTACNS